MLNLKANPILEPFNARKNMKGVAKAQESARVRRVWQNSHKYSNHRFGSMEIEAASATSQTKLSDLGAFARLVKTSGFERPPSEKRENTAAAAAARRPVFLSVTLSRARPAFTLNYYTQYGF